MRIQALSLLLFALLVQLTAGISSAEAAARVGEYVGKENIEKMDVMDSPIQYKDSRYYVFYYPPPPVSKNRLVAAVMEATGQVVGEESVLTALAGAAHKYAAWQRLENTYRLSFADFSTFLNDYRRRLTAASPSTVVSSIQSTHPAVSLAQVERKLGSMETRMDLLAEVLEQGTELRTAFTAEYSTIALSNMFLHYNKTFSSFSEFLASAEAYQAAVLDAQDKVRTSKNLSVADKENILKALSPIYDAGDPGKFKDSFVSGKDYYETRVADEEKWAGDSVSGFLFLKAKVDALKAYESVQPQVQGILASEFAFKACALAEDWKELADAWREIEALKARATQEAYQNISWKTSGIQAMVSALKDKYNKCIQATPKPGPGPDTSSIIQAGLALVAIILVGYAAYKYYKQKQQEEL